LGKFAIFGQTLNKLWEVYMAIKFGQFLIETKKITEEQLKRALSSQVEEHYKLGQVGKFLGKMEDEQVDLVLKTMTEEKHAGKKFGEVAIELNFITSNDLQEILEMEEEINIRIGKILAMSGFIAQEEIDKYLKEFNKS